MIDVEVWPGFEAGGYEVDDALEGRLLIVSIYRPVADLSDCSIRIRVDEAEEIFEPAFSNERIAFEVEEHVAWRWLGQRGETEARLCRQDLVEDRSLEPSLDLQPSLPVNLLVGYAVAVGWLSLKRQWHRGELATVSTPCLFQSSI
jgi:hypothetical protein